MDQADQQPNLIEPVRPPEPIPVLFLVILVVFPGLCWALDFGLSYLLVSATCNGDFVHIRTTLHIIMALMLVGTVGTFLISLRIWFKTRHSSDDPRAIRTNFLAAAAMLMAILFTFGVILASMAPFFTPVCQKV